jgi:flavorubredoxin
MFPLVHQAVSSVMPADKLRWVSFSHYEADECGSLNEWLEVAPRATPLCGPIAAMLSIGDVADRPPRVLEDGKALSLGEMQVRWFDAPHVPHNWEAGYLSETTTRTLFCGDIFTQPGANHEPITESDILGPAEQARKELDYFANPKEAARVIRRLAAFEPLTLACMHGASYRGKGGDMLRSLARVLGAD